jgi:hypothetical protein
MGAAIVAKRGKGLVGHRNELARRTGTGSSGIIERSENTKVIDSHYLCMAKLAIGIVIALSLVVLQHIKELPLKRRGVSVQARRKRLRVPVTRRLSLLTRLANLRLLLLAQLDLQRSHILLDSRNRGRARDGEEVVSLGQNPRQSQLAGSAVLLLGDLSDAVHEFEVFGEVLGREAWCEGTEVALFEVIRAANLAAEHAAADGRVGDDGYAEFAGGLEETDLVGFDVETEGRVSISVVSWCCRCMCWVERTLTRSEWRRCGPPCRLF